MREKCNIIKEASARGRNVFAHRHGWLTIENCKGASKLEFERTQTEESQLGGLQLERGNMEGAALQEPEDSLERVYDVVSRLEHYGIEEVLFYAAQVLAELMDSKDVAIYNVANRGYARLFSATSADARKLGNSIEYKAMGDMYDALVAGRIYMNKDMVENRPHMASAIYSGEEIRAILMIWGIPREKLTEGRMKRLTVIGLLVQREVLRANRHMASFRSRNRLEGTNALHEEAFMVLVSAFFSARDKGLTECSLMEVKTGYQDYEEIATAVACNIRQTDYMGMMKDGRFYVLLPNTDKENAKVVQVRLKEQGYRTELKDVEAIR